MKKYLLIILAGLLSIYCVNAQKFIPKPNPPRLVVDNASLLSPSDAEALERKLVAMDDSTSNQIAVVLVKTLNDEPIEEVANKTFREWGIGNKKTNNGVLLLVAVDDRKVKIEVGYGLEGAIPDITCNDIIEKDIKTAFKQNNFIGGLVKATDDIGKAAAGEYHVQTNRSNQAPSKGGIGSLIKFILIVVVVIVILASRGGGGGGLLFLPFLLGGGGGGGNWDSGGSGGGSFGGFGGGSSGGGGASGSW